MPLPPSPQPTTGRHAVCLYACRHLWLYSHSCRATATCPATGYVHSLIAATCLAFLCHPLFLLLLPVLLPLVYIISLLCTSMQCIPVCQHMTVHVIPSNIPVYCSWQLNESHIFKQRTSTCIYCIPVRSAYWYASISLFMLFPTAYQYAGVPELNKNLIFKKHTSTRI